MLIKFALNILTEQKKLLGILLKSLSIMVPISEKDAQSWPVIKQFEHIETEIDYLTSLFKKHFPDNRY